uniref:Methionine aminopeptidase n=1 Tax=Trichuris muris TaxID=70415 RepID=A0A5S6R6A4_TRIMR
MTDVVNLCQTPHCGKPATLKCPVCLKLELPPAFFCSQPCFKSFWNVHKKKHKPREAETLYPNFSYSGSLRPHQQSSRRTVPDSIERPDYVCHPRGISLLEMSTKQSSVIQVLNDEEIEAMRVSCKLAREVMDEAAAQISVGMTTDEIDRIVHEASVERDCYPSPLGYHMFPKSCCTSVNEVICHGIPDLRPLADGDIVNLDITLYHRGFHGDLNETFFVGNVSDSAKQLVRVTYECLTESIKIVKPGTKYREIGGVIEKYARSHGFSVVRSYCGHGINRLFHTVPTVPHYSKNKAVGVMKAGHTFTIEPMINQGTYHEIHWPDKWTATTADGKLSAQFEQTLLVTDTGCDILTARPTHDGKPWFMDNI